MRTAGARVTKEPVDAEFFKGRSACVCDPKANYFEITWAEPNNPITAWRPNKNSARGPRERPLDRTGWGANASHTSQSPRCSPIREAEQPEVD